MVDFDALSPEDIERLKRRYEESDETLAAIGADEEMTPAQLQALRRTFGWRLRSARKPGPKSPARRKRAARPAQRKLVARAKKQAAPKPARRPQTPPPPGVVDIATLIARIRAQLEAALQTAQARGPGADPEETARLMNSLTRTLQMLRALEKDTDKDDRRDDGADAIPLDLAELRRELARRIDLLRADGEDA
ncbi:MAG TPA: hypothetical protein PKA55_11420 [Rhodoblastus sp.]|nr:hypothetical protein [Rhodoblastus sp.]